MRSTPSRVAPDTGAVPASQQYQRAFTAHLRNPRANPRPDGVPARRIRIYREAVFNNVETVLRACFPLSRRILGARRWERLVRAFLAEHPCRTPLFRQIPYEFVQYLREERVARAGDVPFLPDLAHYEWVELALDICPVEPDLGAIARDGDLLCERPALNPVAMLLSYPYPVHRIGPRFRPGRPSPQQSRILVFRNLHDQVRFIALNAASARLVALLHAGRLTGREALDTIAHELQHPAPEVLVRGGCQTLENLRTEQAILGTWRR